MIFRVKKNKTNFKLQSIQVDHLGVKSCKIVTTAQCLTWSPCLLQRLYICYYIYCLHVYSLECKDHNYFWSLFAIISKKHVKISGNLLLQLIMQLWCCLKKSSVQCFCVFSVFLPLSHHVLFMGNLKNCRPVNWQVLKLTKTPLTFFPRYFCLSVICHAVCMFTFL